MGNDSGGESGTKKEKEERKKGTRGLK